MFRACLWQFLWSENGVELARFLRERKVNASIIYITDYPGFALDSFSVSPLEYPLKPVDEWRLAAALDWDQMCIRDSILTGRIYKGKQEHMPQILLSKGLTGQGRCGKLSHPVDLDFIHGGYRARFPIAIHPRLVLSLIHI